MTDNNYASILCEYCPYTEYGLQPSECIDENGAYLSCEGYFCMRAFNNYIKVTDDNRLIKDFFDDNIKNSKENKLYE